MCRCVKHSRIDTYGLRFHYFSASDLETILIMLKHDRPGMSGLQEEQSWSGPAFFFR
jgi:hypothetical protein